MPRPKSSRKTEWRVQPWQTVERTNRLSVKPRERTASPEPRPKEDGVSLDLDAERESELRAGLDAFVRDFPIPNDVAAVAVANAGALCFLVFEESGSHFVGFVTKSCPAGPRIAVRGVKQSAAFPDCRYSDARTLYDLEILDPEGKIRLPVVNTGGDLARLATENEGPDSQAVSFQGMELRANASENSILRPYFCSDEAIVNVGVMQIQKWSSNSTLQFNEH